MSLHDDYFDLESAWQAYDKAYAAWGRAVEGTEANRFKPASHKRQNERALKLASALIDLRQAAQKKLEHLRRNGWPVQP